MNKFFLSVLLTCAALDALAQADSPVGGLNVATERARIADERAAIARATATERAACYQKFAVDSCLSESRERRREQTDHLKRQQTQLNDAERKQRGAAEMQRLETNKKDADDAARNIERAREDQRRREQRATEDQNVRAEAAAAAPTNARQFEDKQRSFVRQQRDAAARAAQSPMERERYDRKLQEAAAHQAALEKRMAERTKPRSPGLPAPP